MGCVKLKELIILEFLYIQVESFGPDSHKSSLIHLSLEYTCRALQFGLQDTDIAENLDFTGGGDDIFGLHAL